MLSSLHFKISNLFLFLSLKPFLKQNFEWCIWIFGIIVSQSETILLTFINCLYLLCFIVFWGFGLSKKRLCAFPSKKETFCQHLVWVNSLATQVMGGLCWTSVFGSITKLVLKHRPAPRVQRLKRQLVTTKPTCGVFW